MPLVDMHPQAERMRPVSYGQRLRWYIKGSKTQYPVRCLQCGRKTRGNRLIGYWLACQPHFTKGGLL